MMRLHRLPGLLVLLALALPAAADVYKYYDKDGNLVLSDAVPNDRAEKAEKLTPNPIMTVPALKTGKPAYGSATATERAAAPVRGNYEIVIQSPGADEHYRTVDEAIPIAFSVSPALQDGHSLATLLNGKPAADVYAIAPEPLGRGSHTLEVRVADAEGKVLKSSSVTFHIQQPSVLGPLRKPKPQTGNRK
jgi:hypothetical protein